jgi:hypothetical protein
MVEAAVRGSGVMMVWEALRFDRGAASRVVEILHHLIEL